MKCDCCGKEFKIGDAVFKDGVHIATYCSADCMAYSMLDVQEFVWNGEPEEEVEQWDDEDDY